jgi:signal transduction histidine kinase
MSRPAHSVLLRKRKVLTSTACLALIATLLPAMGQTPAPAPQGPWEQYKIQLTPQEIAWVRSHPTLRLGFDPAWPPFSFRGANGAWQGIDFDLLAHLTQRLGIQFVPVETKSWLETDRKIHAGEVDVVSGITPTGDREKYLLFTQPYITCPVAVITRQEAPFLTTLHDLKNVTLASPRDYVTTEQLRRDYPDVPLILTSNIREALTLVSRKKADVAVENLPAASFTIKAAGLKNLKIAGITDYHFGACLAVRRDMPELQSVLQKGLDSMDSAERNAIMNHWAAVEYFPRADWSRVWEISGALLFFGAVVFGLFAWWNRRLSRELAERRIAEAALKAAHDSLHALNREKDRFMTMAAHDLNNPLTAIMMKCIVFEFDEDFSRENIHSMLATIRNNAQRMTHLIKNLLKADRLEHGRMQFRFGVLDLCALAREAMEVMQPCAECKQIHMIFASSPAPLRIRADRDALLQVLENLLSNAIKFTPSEKSITVALSIREGQARIEIRDQGPGIPPEEMPRLFGKYATLSARPTGNEDSNGLGLSIAKSLVDAMKGRITCESPPGGGAVFGVEFPLESAPVAAIP